MLYVTHVHMYVYFAFQGLILHQKQIIINILAIIYNYSYIELVKYVLIILRCPRTMHFIQGMIEVNNFNVNFKVILLKHTI